MDTADYLAKKLGIKKPHTDRVLMTIRKPNEINDFTFYSFVKILDEFHKLKNKNQ